MPFIGGRATASRGYFGGGSRPTAPFALSSIESNGQLTISFSPPPFSGGLPIENYEYALSTNNGITYGDWIPFSPEEISSPVIISGLTNGQKYFVRLRAVNALGGGLTSASLSTNTTPFTIAGSPTITSVVPQNGSVLVSYNAPTFDGGRPIQGYMIQYSSNNGASWSSPIDSGNDLSHTIPGLSNGVSYIFRAYAYTIAGNGLISTNSSPAIPRTVPSQVATPTSSSSDRSFSISWTDPYDGGSAITGYIVEYSTNNGTSWTGTKTETASARSTSWYVSNGSSYIGRVRAVNVAGNGSFSASSIDRIPTFAAPSLSAGGGWTDINQPYVRWINWDVDPTDTSGVNKSTEIIVQWMYPNGRYDTPNATEQVVATYSNETQRHYGSGTSFTNSGTVLRDEQYRVKARQTTDGHSVETGWINVSIAGTQTAPVGTSTTWTTTDTNVELYTTGTFRVNGNAYLNWSVGRPGGASTSNIGDIQHQVSNFVITATSRNDANGKITSASSSTRNFVILYSHDKAENTAVYTSINSNGWPGSTNRTMTYTWNVVNNNFGLPDAGRVGIDGQGSSDPWSPIIDVVIVCKGNKRRLDNVPYYY